MLSAKLASQKGVTMIEVLVSVIILSIGLLGLAGLQSAGITHNQSASFRSTATMMTYSILDSLRANRAEASNGNYNIALGATKPTGDAIYQKDLNNWMTELALRLPTGQGSVAVDNNNNVMITIQWDDSRGSMAAQQFIMATRL
ncbi:MAG: type IV pilus modification protein PilV [Nitrosomonas sp.]|jgi:type IV pilus assembly protein PilV|nr:type IV pilus modification protein PilV [Nitrosomonas sp.]MBK7365497.1 type IV pilus modification protein PilV [Nitrosomonas sp.]